MFNQLIETLKSP